MRVVVFLTLIALAFAGSYKGKSYGGSKKSSKRSSGGSKKTTKPTKDSGCDDTTTEEPTTTEALDICACWDIDLMADPTVTSTEVCYYYYVTPVSDDAYCVDVLDYILIETTNECGIDVTASVTEYTPGCYDLDVVEDGVKLTIGKMMTGRFVHFYFV